MWKLLPLLAILANLILTVTSDTHTIVTTKTKTVAAASSAAGSDGGNDTAPAKATASAISTTIIKSHEHTHKKCAANEKYVKCPEKLCQPQVCEHVGFPQCSSHDEKYLKEDKLDPEGGTEAPCPGLPACVCKDNYVRNHEGICMPAKDCPSCGNDKNSTFGCGVNCGRRCSNYDKGPVSCVEACYTNSCDCKEGYVFDDYRGHCVMPEDCSNKDSTEPEGTEGTPGNGEDENTGTDPCDDCEEKNCDIQGTTRPDGGKRTCSTKGGDEGGRTEDPNAGDNMTTENSKSSEEPGSTTTVLEMITEGSGPGATTGSPGTGTTTGESGSGATTSGSEMETTTGGSGPEVTTGGSGMDLTTGDSEMGSATRKHNKKRRTTTTSSSGEPHSSTDASEMTTEGSEPAATTSESGMDTTTEQSGSEAITGGSGMESTTRDSGMELATRRHKKKRKITISPSSREPHSTTDGSEITTEGSGLEATTGGSGIKTTTGESGPKATTGDSGVETTTGDLGKQLTTRRHKTTTKKHKITTTLSSENLKSSTDVSEMTTEGCEEKITTEDYEGAEMTEHPDTRSTTELTEDWRGGETTEHPDTRSTTESTDDSEDAETTKYSCTGSTTESTEDSEGGGKKTEHPDTGLTTESTDDSEAGETTEHPDIGSTTELTEDSESEGKTEHPDTCSTTEYSEVGETTKYPDTESTTELTGDPKGGETTEHPDAGSTTESTDKSNTTTESESLSTIEASTTIKSTKIPRTTKKPSGEANTSPIPKITRKPRTTTRRPKRTKMPGSTTPSEHPDARSTTEFTDKSNTTTESESTSTTETSTTTKSTKRPRTTKKPSGEANTTPRPKITRKPRTTTASGEGTTTGGSTETTTTDSTMTTTEQHSTTMRGPKDCKGRQKLYVPCAPSCPQKTCVDYLNGVKCPINKGLPKCKPECRCQTGYYKDDEGNCLSTWECKRWARSTTNAMTSSTTTSNPNNQDTTADSTTTMMSTTPQPNCGDVAKELFIIGNLAYTIKLMSDMSERDPDNNVLVGGASLLYLFAQLVSEAKGYVKTELLKVINLNEEQTRCLLPKISADLTTQYPDIEYSLFCKIYASAGYALTDDFIQGTSQLFVMGPQNLNFNSSEAAQKINSDVAKNTNDLFLNYVKPNTLSLMHGLIVVDAEGFQGKWEKPFNPAETIMKDFFSAGRNEKIPTMYQKGIFLYAYNARLNAKILKLRYEGGRFTLAIFLPNSIYGITDLLAKMENPRNTASALDGLKHELVKVYLPTFNVSVANMLKMSSEMAGIKEIFNNSTTGLKDIGSEKPPFVGDILQRIYYTVNEYGMGNKSEVDFHKPEEIPRFPKFAVTRLFKADYPFVYMLSFDKIVLFAGVFVN